MNQALKASCHMLDPLPGSDPAYEQVVALNEERAAENAALVAENDRLRSAIRKARLYAGEHLPAGAGTGIVHILESALKEVS
tara:strand:+ start:76603 stop:76848 length:246 start_codon:yes stop_codon:yes gene_type:complete